MSKVKYRVREFNPKANQSGSHSWFAEVVISNEVDNAQLAKKIAARTGFKSYECQAVVAAISEIVAEEMLAGNRVCMSDEKGTRMISIYPRVTGNVSDADVQANPQKYDNATVATEKMLTPDMLKWTVGATMGIKFSREFALNKQAAKVKMVGSDVDLDDSEEETPGNSNGGSTEPTTPSGGGSNGGGSDGME